MKKSFVEDQQICKSTLAGGIQPLSYFMLIFKLV